MKNIKKVLIIVLMTMVLTTGCTKSFRNEETKKVYTENILCKPTDEEALKAYAENENVDLEKLPVCENLKVNSGGYEGLWTNIFVKPLAWLIVKVGLLVKNYGLSIILIGIALRLLVLPLSKQTMDMSTNMQKANPELQRLEKKYLNRTDRDSLMAKNQEMLLIYKKYNIKPMAGCLVSLIQLPLFFAFLEAIQRIPAILEERMLGFDLGLTPWEAIRSGSYIYLIIVILIGLTTYFSFKNAGMTSMSEEQAVQTKMMTRMMTVFIVLMSFTLNVGIGIYWISSSAFAILQNMILKRRKSN